MKMQKEIIQGFQLSPQQRRLWAMQQSGASRTYRVQCAILIEGNLDQQALEEAIQQTVGRNEILRTAFHALHEVVFPVQVITRGTRLAPDLHDLTALSPSAQEKRIETLFAEMGQRPFDLKQTPLLRLSFLKLSPYRRILMLCLPALCGDTKTLNNLAREISRAYGAAVQAEGVPDEKIQYAVISEWYNELLEEEDTRGGREYWAGLPYSALDDLKLPYEGVFSERFEFAPQSTRVVIDAGLAAGVEALTQEHKISVSTFLLTCWQALLWRLTRSHDLVVGVAFDGRTDIELESCLGLLTKYLPIHCRVQDKLRFSHLLLNTGEAFREAYEWQECFVWDQVASDGKEFLPFCYEFAQRAEPSSAACVTFTMFKQYSCIDRFTTKLSCIKTDQRMELEVQYDANMISAQQAARLLSEYVTVVQGAILEPEQEIGKLEIISQKEREQLIEGFNDTAEPYSFVSVAKQFRQQVEASRERVAVEYQGEKISYDVLNKRANQLANHLINKGVGREELVGICLDRSIEMVVAVLGVLKAGAAYVPLDPAYPSERLEYMIEDAGVKVVLSESRVAKEKLKATADVVRVDQEVEALQRQSETEPGVEVEGENLAYVIYTSGSTGKPKGAMIPHRALANHMFWMQRQFPLDENDRVLQKTPFSFDASVWEFYAPLLAGGELVMARVGGHQDTRYLVEVIRGRKITVVQMVPTLLRALLQEEDISKCESLRMIYSGGEALGVELAQRCKRNLAARLTNLYGPTEAAIDTTYWECEDGESRSIAIGRPISNVEVYVLGERLEVVGMGVGGELYIGGEGLGRGYRGRADMTAERFIPHPFSSEPGRRLYKTGDLGRYREDGSLEYLGRIDQQVKIRGYRIELGEIEAVLEQHADIQQAVVLAREDNQGDKRLVAYVHARQVSELSPSGLHGYLSDKLPDYMWPAKYVVLEELPLMPNGKVNLKALEELGADKREMKESFVAPRTQTQEVLAGIWARTLGVEHVGIYDSFFELGGQSLIATQVVSRIREIFHVDIALSKLFDSPRVADLAEVIESSLRSGQRVTASPIERISRDTELPLSFAQLRLGFIHHLDPDASFYNIPTALRVRGKLNVAALIRSINEIVRRHEVLRTTFVNRQGHLVQVVAREQELKPLEIDLSKWPEDKRESEAQLIVAREAHRPFDLAKGPLLRTAIIKVGEEDHVALLTMHHIVFDNWSSGVLTRELGSLYEAFSAGKPSPLPELPIQYADFSYWQRNLLQGEALEEHLAYWKQSLAGPLPVLKLPASKPRPEVPTYRVVARSLMLSEELSASLNALSIGEGVTLFMTLLAAYDLLLYRYTGQDDVIVGCPIANRNRSEIEGLIGYFANNLVIRTCLSGNPSFRELLARVRNITLSAFAHQDLPYDKIVEELQPERNLSHTPLFQAVFSLQNAPAQSLQLPGLTLSSFRNGQEMTMLDLFLSIIQTRRGLIATLAANSDVYEAVTVNQMLDHYVAVLEQVAAQPDIEILSILLNKDEDQTYDPISILQGTYEVEQFDF